LPFVEIKRIDFTMASGGRRNVNIEFGGDRYDPLDTTRALNDTGDLTEGILDEHSYIVCLSIHGIKATRSYGTVLNGIAPNRLGDIIAPSSLEWRAYYEEHISAAMFQKSSQKLRTIGRSYEFNGKTPLVTGEKPTVVLPLASALRTTGGTAEVPLT
jgi:hypothetical protein